MLCQQHWWLIPSSLFIIFFFWGSFFKSLYLTFPFWRVLEDWPLFFPSLRLLDSTFQTHLLVAFSFVIFPSELIPSFQAERSAVIFLHGSSSWVPQGTRPLLMSYWSLNLLISSLHHWVADRDIFVLVLRISRHAPLNCFSTNLAFLHILRILSS